jgi:hypothetical protein
LQYIRENHIYDTPLIPWHFRHKPNTSYDYNHPTAIANLPSTITLITFTQTHQIPPHHPIPAFINENSLTITPPHPPYNTTRSILYAIAVIVNSASLNTQYTINLPKGVQDRLTKTEPSANDYDIINAIIEHPNFVKFHLNTYAQPPPNQLAAKYVEIAKAPTQANHTLQALYSSQITLSYLYEQRWTFENARDAEPQLSTIYHQPNIQQIMTSIANRKKLSNHATPFVLAFFNVT